MISFSKKQSLRRKKMRLEKGISGKTTPKKDHGRRPPPRPASLPLSQFSHGELTMRHIRLDPLDGGCSILAKTSRHCNKSFPNPSGFLWFKECNLVSATARE